MDRTAVRAAIAERRAARMAGGTTADALPHSLMLRLAAEAARLRHLPTDVGGDVYGDMAADVLGQVAQGSALAVVTERPNLRRMAAAVADRYKRAAAKVAPSADLTASGSEDEEMAAKVGGSPRARMAGIPRVDVYAVGDFSRESMRPADVVSALWSDRAAREAGTLLPWAPVRPAEQEAWTLAGGADALWAGYVSERLATYRTKVSQPGDVLRRRGMSWAAVSPDESRSGQRALRDAARGWARHVDSMPARVAESTASAIRDSGARSDGLLAALDYSHGPFSPMVVGPEALARFVGPVVRTAHLGDTADDVGKGARRWESVERSDGCPTFAAVLLRDGGPVGGADGPAYLASLSESGHLRCFLPSAGTVRLLPFTVGAAVTAQRAADAMGAARRLTTARQVIRGLLAVTNT